MLHTNAADVCEWKVSLRLFTDNNYSQLCLKQSSIIILWILH